MPSPSGGYVAKACRSSNALAHCRPTRSWTTSSLPNHGGDAVVAPNNIRVACRLSSTFEHLCARITSREASCVVLLVYRSGSQVVSPQFFTELTKILQHVSTLALPVVLTGNVNIRLDRPDDASRQQFTELLVSFDLLQHVNQPTHDFGGIPDVLVAHGPTSLIQWSRLSTSASPTIVSSSEHDVESSTPVYETSSRRSWSGFDVEMFRSAAIRESNLCDVKYVASQSVIGDTVKEYDSTIIKILDRLAPITQVTRRTRQSDPWFDDDGRARKRETSRLEKRYRTSRAPPDSVVDFKCQKYPQILCGQEPFILDE